MPRIISFHYELRDALGHRLDSSHPGRPITFVDGEHHLISGLERALKKLKPGDHREVLIPADEAYGHYDDSLVICLPRSDLDESRTLEVGRSFKIGVQGEETRVFQVVDLTDTNVTLDGNHPLAGQDIIVDVELLQSRPMQEEESPGGFSLKPGQLLQ
jgi:FKBP-type peptidyl-prolyl cis-trans isomerase SlyD